MTKEGVQSRIRSSIGNLSKKIQISSTLSDSEKSGLRIDIKMSSLTALIASLVIAVACSSSNSDNFGSTDEPIRDGLIQTPIDNSEEDMPGLVGGSFRCEEGNVVDVWAKVSNRGEGELTIMGITEEPLYQSIIFEVTPEKRGLSYGGFSIETVDVNDDVGESLPFEATFWAPDLKTIDSDIVRAAVVYSRDIEAVRLMKNGEELSSLNFSSYCAPPTLK